ncbi:MAG: zf-HC2 domain-containing protein [Gemmatimonadetes bacterium]|nr:zf-HC2 domain-containing protein [Gemmatimonadota bacterium]
MSEEALHLTAERIQALLDGQLPEGDAVRAREHVDACARCRARAEAWEEVFSGLEALPELSPSAGFAGRVLEALPTRERAALPWAARVRSWFGPGTAGAAAGHPAPSRLHELLDGQLSGRRAAAAEAHLRACRACRHEMEGLARVVSTLERLPRPAPSAGFADGVMAAVRMPEPAPALARLRRLAVARVREVVSLRTRKAWAAVAGVAVTPAVVTAMVAWVVFSHPLVTPGSLASFLWIQGSQRVSAATAWMTGAAMESPTVFRAWSAVEGISLAPTTAAAGFIAFSIVTVLAVWVLYLNLFASQGLEGRHAKLRA